MFKRLTKGVKRVFSIEREKKTPSKQKEKDERRSVKRTATEMMMERGTYLYPASKKEIDGMKWGYIHTDGQFLIKPQFDQADDFQENGLAIIRIKDGFGLIDKNGYLIVNPKYTHIRPFSEGRAVVKDRHGFKVIDESGKEVTAAAYAYIGDYKDGRALAAAMAENGKYLYGYLNRRGKEVLPLIYESAEDFREGKTVVKINQNHYALINQTGKVLHTYSCFFAGNYREGLLVFQENSSGPFGYMDECGEKVIDAKFSQAMPFIKGRAIVAVPDEGKNQYGLIDRVGHYIFKPQYHHMLSLGEGRLAIGKIMDQEKNNLASIYAIGDTLGHILTGFIYNSIGRYEHGKASASNDRSTFFIDHNGKRISELPNAVGRGVLKFEKKLIKGEIDGRLFYFDKFGKLVWKQNREISFSNGIKVMEHKYKPNSDFLVYYPQLAGMADKIIQATINQSLKDLAGIKETAHYLQLESNYMGDYKISFCKKYLLVIEINGRHDPQDTSSRMSVNKYANIDLVTGDIYQLKHLFKPGCRYVKMISELIGHQIKTNPAYSCVLLGKFKGIQADQNFYIQNDSLNIYFSPQEIAPYKEGFLTFTIPFEQLTSIIEHTGPFWRAFH